MALTRSFTFLVFQSAILYGHEFYTVLEFIEPGKDVCECATVGYLKRPGPTSHPVVIV